MNYAAHYSALIERAKNRKLEGYSERHHVTPRCLGGSNDKSNIVRLTPEEHYVAHQLLVKIHPGDHRLLWAASNMTGASKRQPGRKNKMYGWLRRRFSEMVSERHRGKTISAEARAKMSAAKRGKKQGPRTPEARAKMSAASKGRKKSAEHCAAMSVARTGMKLRPHSAETKEKIRASNVIAARLRDHAEKQTPEYKSAQAQKMREVWRRRREGELPMPRN